MKKLVMRVNSELFVMAGKVGSVEDRETAYVVTLLYTEFDRPAKTEVFYRNQKERADGKDPIPYADIVRRLNLVPGDFMITSVRFPGNTNEWANGYYAKRDGILSFSDTDRSRSVISGVVIAADDAIVRETVTPELTLFTGYDYRGVPQYATVLCEDPRLREKIGELAPKADGRYSRAVMICGTPQTVRTDNGSNTGVYGLVSYSECCKCIRESEEKQ